MDKDLAIRLAAFKWLEEQTAIHGDVLPRDLLQRGVEFEGERIPLVSPAGIFKPRGMTYPLTLTTVASNPYADAHDDESGVFEYRYRGTNPDHPDNVGVRNAYRDRVPLIYFLGLVPGKYLVIYPILVKGDNPAALTFTLEADDMRFVDRRGQIAAATPYDGEERRKYITTTVKVRAHQRLFRERVIAAYRTQCSLCRLRHDRLLDAAHIIPDCEPLGGPRITNGISLCKIHHGAFDEYFIGVSPDFKVIVREDILKEKDGPMLQHGLKELHGNTIIRPPNKAHWPDREALDWRFERFKKAG